jgi:molybdenum cofactor cytidylyltransferase
MSPTTVGCVILAAGASSRMGRPKALVRTPDGRSFLETILDTARAAGIGPIRVVLGPPHGSLIAEVLPAKVSMAENAHPERGMLSSVQAGVSALPAVQATLIWPVDIPAVRVATVRALVDTDEDSIVIPTHDGRGGHPLRLPARCFPALLALDPGVGLRQLISAEGASVRRWPVDDPNVLVDIDTPEALAKWRPV